MKGTQVYKSQKNRFGFDRERKNAVREMSPNRARLWQVNEETMSAERKGRMKATEHKIPKELSPGEEQFNLHCNAYGLQPEREFKFHPTRKWRFDFAFPELRIAVEVEGGTSFGKSSHSRGDGFKDDCRKYNSASLLGWSVLRFTTDMVQSGEAIDTILPLLGTA